MPFNITGPPISNVDFFSMGYSTLTTHFVESAHNDGKDVYAWTANSNSTIRKMLFDDVDGILTDNLTLAQKTIGEVIDDPAYSDMLLNFVLGFE